MSLFQHSHSRGIFFLITLLLAANQVNDLDDDEVIALKDMQAEWGNSTWMEKLSQLFLVWGYL